MSIGGWLAFVHDAGLLRWQQLTLSQARLVFLRSRIRTSPSAGEEMLRCHLRFEDWLEALTRLATIMRWPTDDELRAAGAKDAAEFIADLREQERIHKRRRQQVYPYQAFLQANAAASNSPLETPATWRCLDHLIRLVAVQMVNPNGSSTAFG